MITLTYISLTPAEVRAAFYADVLAKDDGASAHGVKVAALAKLGIAPQNGESPLDAWTRTMCERNNLVWTKPVPDVLGKAVADDAGARLFVFFLAGRQS